MPVSRYTEFRMPFPWVPDSIRAKHSVANLSLRPFGLTEDDLEVDFHLKERPSLVTAILQCCTEDNTGVAPEEDFFWDLTVGKRTECLLSVATRGGMSKPAVQLQCVNDSCHEPMEVEVSFEKMSALQRHADSDEDVVVSLDKGMITLRKPTGKDQMKWLHNSFPNEVTAIKKMVEILIREDEKPESIGAEMLSGELPEVLNRTMEKADPLAGLKIRTKCPACSLDADYDLDLEQLSFNILYKAQKKLLQTIHNLAVHYNWSESAILSIPAWRRDNYLVMIEKEGNQ